MRAEAYDNAGGVGASPRRGAAGGAGCGSRLWSRRAVGSGGRRGGALGVELVSGAGRRLAGRGGTWLVLPVLGACGRETITSWRGKEALAGGRIGLGREP